MAKRKFKTLLDEKSGIRFVFKYDEADPSLLHIYARHLANPKDAIATFHEGETAWNKEHSRFETVSETQVRTGSGCRREAS